jgi:hypothetical protein
LLQSGITQTTGRFLRFKRKQNPALGANANALQAQIRALSAKTRFKRSRKYALSGNTGFKRKQVLSAQAKTRFKRTIAL